jgi:hypothetical protein
MSDAVVAAIVAGIVSLLATFGKIVWDATEKKQDRRLAAREKLDRYREPLLTAADDLGRLFKTILADRENYSTQLDHHSACQRINGLSR